MHTRLTRSEPYVGRALHVAPIDNRIAVQSCQQSLQFDQPFPGQASVRVRCGQPIWQLYVTLNAGNAPAAVARNGLAAPAVQKVLVAKEMLKRGTLLTPAMFTATEMPAPGMESQLINDPKLYEDLRAALGKLNDGLDSFKAVAAKAEKGEAVFQWMTMQMPEWGREGWRRTEALSTWALSEESR